MSSNIYKRMAYIIYLWGRMSTIVVKAQIFGIVDEFTPVLVWRELGVLVEHIVGHVIHEPVETLTLQFLFQPATKNLLVNAPKFAQFHRDSWLNANDQFMDMRFTIKTVLIILTPAAGICLPCRRILPGVPLCRRTPCTPGRTMSQWPSGSSGAWWADRGTCCPVCPSDTTSTSDLGTRETLGSTEPKQSCRRTSKPKKMRIFIFYNFCQPIEL